MTLMTSKVLLLLVWVAVLSPTNVSSFSATTTTTPTATGSSSSSSSSSSLPKIPDNPISAELLQLLKLKFDQVKSDDDDDDKEIDALVYNLINTKSNTFDPTTSINGDFFAAVHTIGPTPLWEKISRGGTNPTKNLKGQKYTIGDNDENIVVNYSEILGNAINLKAFGTFTDRGPVGTSAVSAAVMPNGESSSGDIVTTSKSSSGFSFINPFQSFISKPKNVKENLCPYDYDVTVTGASIEVFGFQVNIPISGTGCARVLYADPCLRIFISPNDTNVETGGGDWESAGLISVQVRVDLLLNSPWNVVL